MFVTPEWEIDVPNVKANFVKKAKSVKLKRSENSDSIVKKINNIQTTRQSNGKDGSKILSYFEDKTQLTQISQNNSDADTLKNIYFGTINPKKLSTTKTKSKKSKKNINVPDQKTTIQKQNEIITSSSQILSPNLENTEKQIKKRKRKTTDQVQNNVKLKMKKSNNTVNEHVDKRDETKKLQFNGTAIPKILVNEEICKKKSKDQTSTDLVTSVVINDNDIGEKRVNNKQKDIIKKQKFQKLLQESNKTTKKTNSGILRERMLERLKAAQFRYLNERLYTSSGNEASELFAQDPAAFRAYHVGYQHQLAKWPVNPLDVIIKKITRMPKTITIADMGCGDAALSRRVQQSVRSFDLVANAPGVEACNMARTPLAPAAVDVAVYCLALMGTNLTEYLLEANRILKMGGLLLIAEVESRFDDPDAFARDVQRLGFKLIKLDKSHDVFVFLEFKKVQSPPAKKSKLPTLLLKPCLYKRR